MAVHYVRKHALGKPFQELEVLEVAGGVAGAYAAKLFADLGARVTKLEPPGGDPARTAGAHWGGWGTEFVWLNTSKSSRVLDLTDPAGRAELHELAAEADCLIESSAPDPLDPLDLPGDLPHLVRVQISPFGSSGPYARFRSNEFTDDALGGQLYLNGEPDREPLARPGLHAQYQAGGHAFVGALAALRARERIGRGQCVEVAHLEGLASMHQHTTSMWTHGRHVLRRSGNAQPGMWHPAGVYRCKDGWVAIVLSTSHKVEPFLAAAGLSEVWNDPRFQTDIARGQHKREFDAALEPWLRAHTCAEIVELGQGVFTPVGPVPSLLEVLDDEQLVARGSFATLRAEDRELRLPRGPFRVEGHASSPEPPPALDERRERPSPPRRPGAPAAPSSSLERGPLDGVRVLDLTRVWAGPFAGRLLADLGADVILVEAPWARGPREVSPEAPRVTHLFPDDQLGSRPWNRVAGFNKLARNKRSVTLDLARPEGLALFERLVAHSDVVLENYSPRVMPQLGLGCERLRELNPHVVHVGMPGYGATGPRRDWVAFGPMIEAGSGLTQRMGYADSGPIRSGVAWADPVSGLHAVAATLVALWDRDADPERRGRDVEVAMIEAMTMGVGEQLLHAQVTGRVPARCGSRHPARAPQGCYPCAGEDRWLAISVTRDCEWRALCEALELPAHWAEFDEPARRARHDEIDTELASRTRGHEPQALMRALQARGVIAAAVSDARDLVEDPQLAARRFWAELPHRDAGTHRMPGQPLRFSATPARFRLPAPGLGEHNAEVLGELLGLDAREIAALQDRGVIVDEPPG